VAFTVDVAATEARPPIFNSPSAPSVDVEDNVKPPIIVRDPETEEDPSDTTDVAPDKDSVPIEFNSLEQNKEMPPLIILLAVLPTVA
jgi:hypothetical protein